MRVWPGSRKDLAFALVAQAIKESHLAQHVHANTCRLEKRECDSVRVYDASTRSVVYVQNSFSPWQLKKFDDIPAEEWEQIRSGIPGTKYAAWHAARRFSSAYRACEGYAGAFSRYATGSSCSWYGAKERVTFLESLKRKSEYELTRLVEMRRARVQAERPEALPDESKEPDVVAVR